jgi:hypothetical protein
VADADDIEFFGDEVFEANFRRWRVEDLSTAVVGVTVAEVFELFANDGQDVTFIAEEAFMLGNLRAELSVLLDNFRRVRERRAGRVCMRTTASACSSDML